MQPLDAERVKEWRHRRMLSQQEVADRAGTSLFTIQRIERGEGNVRPKTGRGLAAALDVPIEELLPKAQAPLFREPPEHDPPEERRGDAYDVALDAARRQAIQDRQAANRAIESGRAQAYFMRHDNEAVMELLKYPADELAGALLEVAVAFEHERRNFILAKAIAAAAERWVGITSGDSSDDEDAPGVYLAAADLEGLLSVEVGDYEAWEKLSDGERSEIATVMAALGRVTEGYHEQREAEQDTERRRALVRQWTRELTESA